MKSKRHCNLYTLLYTTLYITLMTMSSVSSNANSIAKIEFKQYTEKSMDIKEMAWCGEKDEFVFILTRDNRLFRLSEAGSNLELFDSILVKKAKIKIKSEEGEEGIGKVKKIITYGKINKSLVVLLGTESIFWVSKNCGDNYTAYNHERSVEKFLLNPTKPNEALISSYTFCVMSNSKYPCEFKRELYLVDLHEETIRLIASRIEQFTWAVPTENVYLLGIPKSRILVTMKTDTVGHQKFGETSDLNSSLFYTDDYFSTKTELLKGGNRFFMNKKYLLVSQAVASNEMSQISSDSKATSTSLMMAKSYILKYPFVKVDFDVNLSHNSIFTILDASDTAVFISVVSQTAKYGNIYKSDINGEHFSKTINFNVKAGDEFDFDKVQGTGIYIANIIDYDYMKGLILEQKKDLSLEELELKLVDYSKHIKTYITNNNGGRWKRITFNSNGNDKDAKSTSDPNQGNSNLNLHGSQGVYPRFYSADKAPGIIIANGNLGEFLTNDIGKVNTYLSLDAGFTWKEIFKGAHIFEIANKGGVIILAKYKELTKQVKYSLNEGETWTVYEMPLDREVIVDNIRVNPNHSQDYFLLELFDPVKEEKIFASLDTGKLGYKEKICLLEGDYIALPKQCYLGYSVEFRVKKPDSNCYNGPNFVRMRTVETEFCSCGDEDLECNAGYSRENPEAPCTSSKFFGGAYKKIDGDFCVGDGKGAGGIISSHKKISLNVIFYILCFLVLGILGKMAYTKFSELYSDEPIKNYEYLRSFDEERNFSVMDKTRTTYDNKPISHVTTFQGTQMSNELEEDIFIK